MAIKQLVQITSGVFQGDLLYYRGELLCAKSLRGDLVT
jgi:hypothetical protein